MDKPTSIPKRNLDESINRLLDIIDLDAYEESVVNLGKGTPAGNLLMNCCEIFDKATSHRMKVEATNQAKLFEYGPPAGNLPILNQIATFLTDAYQSEVKSEAIFVTTGATQGLHIILSTLIDLNGYVFLDEISYMLALDLFKQFHTIKVIPVKLHDDGVDIEHLRNLLKKNQFRTTCKRYWAIYFAMPTYHNPTGIVFSNDKCQKLIKLAREFDILISCDDVYNILYYEKENAPKRLFAYDDPQDVDFKENVISNGSFSKIIGPGLRFGWIEAHPRCKTFLQKSGVMRSGGCLSNYTAGVMSSVFELGLEKPYVRELKLAFHEQMKAATQILKNNLPKSCSFVTPTGGYYIWIRLPENADATELLKFCLTKYDVFFITGDHFSIEKRFKNCFRISIAQYEKEVLENAVLNICNASMEFLNNNRNVLI